MIFDPTVDVVTNEIINGLINDNMTKANKMKHQYNSYKGKTEIRHRTMPPAKLNNKLINDYRGDIVDTAVGYLFGHPITREIDSKKYSESEYERAKASLEDFLIRNSMDDLDAEVGKMASICGYGAKLLYINEDGEESVTSIVPWQCIFVEDVNNGLPQLALRHYKIESKFGDITKVELYDKKTVKFYEKDSNSGVFTLIEEKDHMFNGVIPLIKYKNNEEEIGDFEKVETLIDAYERTVSDVQNEAEEMRLAYMLFIGLDATSETMIAARQTGGFTLREGEDIKFLTKDINIDFIEKHKETLDSNIYKFSKIPNLSDENFVGNSSGVALKYKLLGLENKAIVKERKFNAADRQMFKALASAWNVKGIKINYLDIFNTFKRNLPSDVAEEISMIEKLAGKGVISIKTLLSQLSFIDSPEYEIEQLTLEATQNNAQMDGETNG